MSSTAASDYSIYSDAYKSRLRDHVIFEAKSYVGRKILRPRPPHIQGERLLQLGTGEHFFEGWCNADFFVFNPKTRHPDWMLDLRYPLNCDSNHWDGIYSEHALEHIHPSDAVKLIREVFRVLKPGAYFRCIVPDLAKYIAHEGVIAERWPTRAEAIWSVTSNWWHLGTWDAELLRRVLGEAGFTDIRQVKFREGSDQRLLKDAASREWESLYMEARKPVEALSPS